METINFDPVDARTLAEEKLLYERFWCLLNDRQLMHLFAKYGPALFRRSSVLEGFETFITSHGFSGECCVEIGTLKGLTALVLARYFKTVVTIDIADDPQKYAIANGLGVRNITFVNVKDNAEKAAVIRGLQFDAAYIDGDHAHDTELDWSLVERCHRVLLHEHWDAQPSVRDKVRQFICDRSGALTTSNKWALWTA